MHWHFIKTKNLKGKIISIFPTDDASVLVITADSVQPGTVKAFKKKFGKKVIVQTPPEEIRLRQSNSITIKTNKIIIKQPFGGCPFGPIPLFFIQDNTQKAPPHIARGAFSKY